MLVLFVRSFIHGQISDSRFLASFAIWCSLRGREDLLQGQSRLYRWMLDERRKVKPRDTAERRRLDDDIALLKEIIRADSLPRL